MRIASRDLLCAPLCGIVDHDKCHCCWLHDDGLRAIANDGLNDVARHRVPSSARRSCVAPAAGGSLRPPAPQAAAAGCSRRRDDVSWRCGLRGTHDVAVAAIAGGRRAQAGITITAAAARLDDEDIAAFSGGL